MKTITLIFTAAIILLFPINLFPTDVTVQLAGGIEKIDYDRIDGIDAFSLSQLAALLGERISWETVGISAVMQTDRHRIRFFVNSPYISIDDTVKNLTFPTALIKGNLFVPAETFTPLFDQIRQERITWDKERRIIRIDSEYFTITDLALSTKANGLLIELFISEPKEYEIYESEGNWLNITIPDATVNRRQILARKNKKIIRDLNVFQFEASAQISLRLRRPIEKYSSRFTPNPGRIQISLLDTTVTISPQNGVGKIGPDNKIDRIVIDAGHGGKDYGAIGLKKTKEKKIVLDISKRLAKLIRKEKLFEVVMTRDKDKYISLEERTRIANESKGDVYVSIHANASLKRNIRGFQVFFLAAAKNDDARAAAQLENAPFLAEINSPDDFNSDNLSLILSDMIQNEFQEESADLASMVDREFRKKLSKNTKARAIDQAAFVVLNGVYMPSILVEAAFLTNKDDEKLLNSKKYRQKVAEAIYAGLKRFKAKYESK